MACPRLILHGGLDSATDKVREALDDLKFTYRLEISPDEQYDGQPELMTPGGRYCGLERIGCLLGKNLLE